VVGFEQLPEEPEETVAPTKLDSPDSEKRLVQSSDDPGGSSRMNSSRLRANMRMNLQARTSGEQKDSSAGDHVSIQEQAEEVVEFDASTGASASSTGANASSSKPDTPKRISRTKTSSWFDETSSWSTARASEYNARVMKLVGRCIPEPLAEADFRRSTVSTRKSPRTPTPRKIIPTPRKSIATPKEMSNSRPSQSPGLGGSLKSWIEKHILFEDRRDVTISAVASVRESREDLPATIRVLENKVTGGIRLAVCLNVKQWTSSQVIERSLHLDEITNLFTWGHKLRESVEARYKWMSDIVHLRATEEMELPMKELPVGEKECSRFRVLFGEFDVIENYGESRQKIGIDIIKGFKQMFQKTQVYCEAETDFNLRTAFKTPGMDEQRKDLEIQSARKKYNLYENTSVALYEWYQRLDISGDGHLDEDEFGSFLRGVVKSFGQSMDDNQVRRHWVEMKNSTTGIGFSQFVSYLFYKFPHVKTMTAFEVKRFEEKSKKSMLEEAVKRDSLTALKSFKESLAEPVEETEVTGFRLVSTPKMDLSIRRTKSNLRFEEEDEDEEESQPGPPAPELAS